jgi:hypothetical protein
MNPKSYLLLSNLLNRLKQSDQDRDDGDNHEQFDQRKPSAGFEEHQVSRKEKTGGILLDNYHEPGYKSIIIKPLG